LLVGAILPLDLRLLGLFGQVPLGRDRAVPVARRRCGRVLAIVTGLWLFSVKPAEYIANAAFLCKAALLALALANVAVQHANHHFAAAVDGGALRANACAWLPCARSCCGCRFWSPAAGSDSSSDGLIDEPTI
jgi:hypothetical protein